MKNAADSRERYEPPTVTRVRFAPGEVAAGACKSTPPSGVTTPNRCNRGGGVVVAFNLGS